MIRSVCLVIGLIAMRMYMPEFFHAFEYSAHLSFSLLDKGIAYIPDSWITQLASVGHFSSMIDGQRFMPGSADLPAFK